MPKCKCPGYNLDVLPKFEAAAHIGDGTTKAAAKTAAKKQAESDAVGKALAQFANHLCPSPCISIPIPKLIGSGADIIAEVEGADSYVAFGWAKAQLDVLCVQIQAPVNPPGASLPQPQTVPGDIAPVTEKSKTKK
jgi:hypothetical protein